MHYKQAVVLARFSMVQNATPYALKWCILGGGRRFPLSSATVLLFSSLKGRYAAFSFWHSPCFIPCVLAAAITNSERRDL
ncbi:hypothetical protein DMH27_20810 [Raoultella planticola]|nr:hypothetical protein [Raoultella planticola]